MAHSPVSNAISTVGSWQREINSILQRLLAFLRRPSIENVEPTNAPWRETTWLFVILCMAMFVVSTILLPLAIFGNVAPSQQLDAALSTPALRAAISIVLVGPIVEEMMFRSWLSGRWHHLIAASAFIAVLFGGRFLTEKLYPGASTLSWYLVVGIALALYAALQSTIPLHGKSKLFEKCFPAIFWISTIGFGALHIVNYAGSIGAALFAFTVPQIIAASVFGYARLRIGLLAAIGLHMAFNAVPLTASLALQYF